MRWPLVCRLTQHLIRQAGYGFGDSYDWVHGGRLDDRSRTPDPRKNVDKFKTRVIETVAILIERLISAPPRTNSVLWFMQPRSREGQ